jgi:hypothetical protein
MLMADLGIAGLPILRKNSFSLFTLCENNETQALYLLFSLFS